MSAGVVIAIVMMLTAAPQDSPYADLFRDMEASTYRALAISYTASRLCPSLAFDEARARGPMSLYHLKSIADVPRRYVVEALAGFDRSTADACEYAWTMYGLGIGGGAPWDLHFLRRVIRNPF